MTSKVLRIFVNILTTDDKYSLLNTDNLRHPIQMQLSPKEKTFSDFFSAVLKCKLNFQHFQKKKTFIADLYPKLRTPKNVVHQISKKSQHVRGTKHC